MTTMATTFGLLTFTFSCKMHYTFKLFTYNYTFLLVQWITNKGCSQNTTILRRYKVQWNKYQPCFHSPKEEVYPLSCFNQFVLTYPDILLCIKYGPFHHVKTATHFITVKRLTSKIVFIKMIRKICKTIFFHLVE